MTVGCDGTVQVSLSEDTTRALRYSYRCTLAAGESLCISKESLKVSYLAPTGRYRTILGVDRADDVRIRVEDKSQLGPYRLPGIGKKKTVKVDYGLQPTQSFFSLLAGFFYYAYEIQNDIASFQLFNIDPHVAKEPNDIS